jgi:glycerol-3-phosphate O-acyltransferase
MSLRRHYLVFSTTDVERAIIDEWMAGEADAPEAGAVAMPHPRAFAADNGDRLVDLLAADDALLTPARVIWLPKARGGERRALPRDLLLGDPRHPARWRQQWLRRWTPDRYRVVSGEPATVGELRERYLASHGDPTDRLGFARFVTRQGVLALERAEYRSVGTQYKVPRLVREEVLESPRFATGVSRLAAELGRDEDEVRTEAVACLDEMVAGYAVLFLDLFAQLGRIMSRPGYGDDVDYDAAQVARMRATFQQHPAIVLPSHKSQLDGLVMARALHDNRLPPTHIFAGINMNIWPFGPLWKRTGRIFIRRSIRDDPVYRWVLREYIGYLTEKRFNLEWYLEGGRSRTGKLLPPKLGLLRYVVDAYGDGRTDDIALVPVSIAYDQLHEVSEYAGEATGGSKKAEGLGWAVNFYRAQRRRFGKIYVRFGEPVSLRAFVGEPGTSIDERGLALQKLAFEVSWRINQITPITAAALVSLVLLSTRGRALSLDELGLATRGLLGHARRRQLPLAASAQRLETPGGLQSVLDSLAGNRIIDVYDQGPETVYRVAGDQQLAAAFYRNTVIHFFVDGSIAEVALLHATEKAEDRLSAFWEEALHLRDLFKFDFFFEPTEDFKKTVAAQLDQRLPGWDERLNQGTDPLVLLGDLQPLQAFAVLRPFLEAYSVVARSLASQPADAVVDEKPFLRSCLALGQQLIRQQHVRSGESISTQLFATGLRLAAHRGLVEPASDVTPRRLSFVAELADVGRRIDLTEQLAYTAFDRSLTAAAG